jgi:P pilus assembly chaperone PapD
MVWKLGLALLVAARTVAAKGRVSLALDTSRPLNEVNPTALRVELSNPAGQRYRLALWVRADLQDENSLDQPLKVAPETAPVGPGPARFTWKLPPWSVTILRLEGR